MTGKQFAKLRVGDYIKWYNKDAECDEYDMVSSIHRDSSRIWVCGRSDPIHFIDAELAGNATYPERSK